MQRICVIGVSGSGKTTLCRALAERLRVPHVELDALYWEPDWKPAPRERFRTRVAAAAEQPQWILDGNYSGARDIAWPSADTFVWLDLALPLILGRLCRRIISRASKGEVLWNGNRETLWRHFIPADSLIVWALKTHPRYRREYVPLLAERESAGCTVIRLRTPLAVKAWLASLP